MDLPDYLDLNYLDIFDEGDSYICV